MRMPRVRVLPAVALVLGVVFFAPAVYACCTSVLCPFAISSSSGCVGGPNMPVCNVFGCNCNVQCGMYTYRTDNKCYFSTPCDGSDDEVKRAQDRFDAVDTNHDGVISGDEVTAWMNSQPDFMKNVNRSSLPSNLQGENTTVADLVSYVFDKADKNHNGTIEPAEFDSTLAKGKGHGHHKRMKKE